jgi:hypothetical protein
MDERNGSYIVILVLSIIMMIVSFIIEYNHPVIENKYIVNLPNVAFLRIIHYYITIYFVFYVLFFPVAGINGVIYLIANLIYNFEWILLKCCILSYYELHQYNDIDFSTTNVYFHPHFTLFLREHVNIVSKIMGYIMLCTVGLILYYNKFISPEWKLLFVLVFSYTVYVCSTGSNPIWNFLEYLNVGSKVEYMKMVLERADRQNKYPDKDDIFFQYFAY